MRLSPQFSLSQPITDWEAWPRPKSPERQWKPGASAQELAKSWFRGGRLSFPEELGALLESHELTRDCELICGRPELVTPLPEPGEGRNHDLWLLGRAAQAQVTICVEAKVMEGFGELTGEKIKAAEANNPRSHQRFRAVELIRLLTGSAQDPTEPPWGHIRYQLIAAAAGTLVQASLDGSQVAVLVVQEFVGGCRYDRECHDRNHDDLIRFLRVLNPSLTLPGGLLAAVSNLLLVGKIESKASD